MGMNPRELAPFSGPTSEGLQHWAAQLADYDCLRKGTGTWLRRWARARAISGTLSMLVIAAVQPGWCKRVGSQV
jgi:hypothetical protein